MRRIDTETYITCDNDLCLVLIGRLLIIYNIFFTGRNIPTLKVGSFLILRCVWLINRILDLCADILRRGVKNKVVSYNNIMFVSERNMIRIEDHCMNILDLTFFNSSYAILAVVSKVISDFCDIHFGGINGVIRCLAVTDIPAEECLPFFNGPCTGIVKDCFHFLSGIRVFDLHFLDKITVAHKSDRHASFVICRAFFYNRIDRKMLSIKIRFVPINGCICYKLSFSLIINVYNLMAAVFIHFGRANYYLHSVIICRLYFIIIFIIKCNVNSCD